MKVVTTLPQNDLRKVPEAARAIEDQGFDGVVTLENRHNPFLPLAVAAVHTERLELATGVAIAFPRSPMVVANLGWDLQAASGGRFVLGLGSQVKGHNVRRFSVPWSPPAPRMREYVEALRAIWRSWSPEARESKERLDYRGDHYQFTLMTPNFTPEPLETPPPPVTIAAVGPATLRVAGRVCDGVRLHAFCTRLYLENTVLPILTSALAESDRKRENFQISGGGFVVTGPDDEAVQRQFDWVRMRVGFYGSTRAYWPVLAEHGLEELGEKLNYLSKNDGWAQMTKEVSDDVVRLFAAVGRHDEIVGAVEERFGGISDVISASASSEIAGDLPTGVIEDLKALPTSFQGFSTSPG